VKLEADPSGRKLSQEQARKRESKLREREIIFGLLALASCFYFALC